MYPNLYYLLKDLTGLEIGFFKIIHTFGFFVAIAFLAAAYFLAKELKRKHEDKLVEPYLSKVFVGGPATTWELFSNGLIGFIIGFKFLAVITDFSTVVDNPQDFMLSFEGSLPGGLVIGGLMAYLKYREKQKARLEKPGWKTIKILPQQMVGDITIYGAIFGFIGAKLFHNLEYLDEFTADPIDALTSFSGLTFYGGLIVGAMGIYYYAYRHKLSLVHLNDALAPSMMLAYGIGRVGCQLSGDGDWGIPNLADKPGWLSFLPDWMWSFNYPNNVISEGLLIPGCEGRYCYVLENQVYPTPFYETMMALVLFGVLWSIRKRVIIPGVLVSVYLILNGIERYFIQQIRVEKIREAAQYDLFGYQIAQAEIISILLVVTGIVGVVYYYRRRLAAKER